MAVGTPVWYDGVTSATLSYQPGDLVIAFAFRSGSTTLPTQPTTPAWVQKRTNALQTAASRVAVFVPTAPGTASGTWTSANRVLFCVIPGAIDANVSSAGSGSSLSVALPALTLTAPGTARVLRLAGHRTATAMSTPSGTTIGRVTAATPILAGWDEGFPSSAAVLASTATGTASGWHAYTVEVLETPPATPLSAEPAPLTLTAGSANPTATLPLRPTPDPVTLVVDEPDPTATLGVLLVTPDPVDVPAVVGDPTADVAAPAGAVTPTPDPVDVPVSLGDPTATVGGITPAPDPLTLTTTPGGTAATLGPLAPSPTPLTVTTTVATPTATLGGITATPDPVTVAATVTDPGAELGGPPAIPGTTPTPDPLTVTAGVGAPSATLGGIGPTPAALALVADVAAPTATLGGAPGTGATPDPITVPVGAGAPAATLGGLAASPAGVTLTGAVGAPSVGLALAVVPDPLEVLAEVEAAAMAGALTATPDPVTLVVDLGAPGAVDRSRYRDIDVTYHGPLVAHVPLHGPAGWEPVTGGPTTTTVHLTGPRS